MEDKKKLKDPHFMALENMYMAAPINKFYSPMIEVSRGEAKIEIVLSEKFFHAANSVHGSVYFKMLDDASFFAANSLKTETFVLTASFTVYLVASVSSGKIHSIGKVINQSKSQFIAEATIYNEQYKAIGHGAGIFVRGKLPLRNALGYSTK